jgi:hypothetical protein
MPTNTTVDTAAQYKRPRIAVMLLVCFSEEESWGLGGGGGKHRSCLVEIYSHVIRKDGWMADRRTHGQWLREFWDQILGVLLRKRGMLV